MSYIEIKNVKKTYDGKNYVLEDINLDIQKGEILTLLGPSGCGKSTLLRAIAGFHNVDEGTIKIDGKIINNLAPRKRNVGMVFQAYSLFPNMNVEQNIAFGLKIKKMNKKEINKKISETIELVGLKGREKYYPSNLSGGQKQRVALARALITEPQVLLLDEPLSAIDAQLRKNLQHSIRRIQKELNITTIFVTHDQGEAMIMSDKITIMNKGKIEQIDSPVDIYTKPKSKFVASFLGNYNVLTSDEFSNLTGLKTSTSIAIRPETIRFHDTLEEDNDKYITVRGKILDMIPVGNILSYTLDVNGVKLKVDSLFRTYNLHQIGQETYASFQKRNVLELEQ